MLSPDGGWWALRAMLFRHAAKMLGLRRCWFAVGEDVVACGGLCLGLFVAGLSIWLRQYSSQAAGDRWEPRHSSLVVFRHSSFSDQWERSLSGAQRNGLNSDRRERSPQ